MRNSWIFKLKNQTGAIEFSVELTTTGFLRRDAEFVENFSGGLKKHIDFITYFRNDFPLLFFRGKKVERNSV